jgi:HTH-type transcriptional regulator/antitoxin HigA
MTKKAIRPIRTDADYEAALADIERFFEREPEPGTPEADRFDLLASVINDYENRKWPIASPDPRES